MQFIIEILCVHYRATNAACRAGLARLSLNQKVKTVALIFGNILTHHINLVNKNDLLTKQTK